jgi:hypothetical protein
MSLLGILSKAFKKKREARGEEVKAELNKISRTKFGRVSADIIDVSKNLGVGIKEATKSYAEEHPEDFKKKTVKNKITGKTETVYSPRFSLSNYGRNIKKTPQNLVTAVKIVGRVFYDIFRTAQSAGITLSKKTGGPGLPQKTGKIGEFFGEEEVKGFEQRVEETAEISKQLGAIREELSSKILGITGVGLMTYLDVTVGGGVKKKVTKEVFEQAVKEFGEKKTIRLLKEGGEPLLKKNLRLPSVIRPTTTKGRAVAEFKLAEAAKKEKKDLLDSIKLDIERGIKRGIYKERGLIKKKITKMQEQKELSGNALKLLREKNEIREWKNATQKQLDAVLDDLDALKKGDEFLSRPQVISLEEFGIKPWTTKREIGEILGDVTNWKKRNNRLLNSLKTMENRIEVSAGKDADKVKDILTRPRAKAVTGMIDEELTLKTEMREVIFDKLKLKSKKDQALIMRFGEKRMTLEALQKVSPKKWKNIVEADQWFRAKYDELLDSTNTVLRKFGQKEIPKRKDYYTHFQEVGSLWSGALKKGIEINPALEGISMFTKPNSKFNPFAQARKGGKFEENAVRAFEAYLAPTLNNKYITPEIIRHNAIADILAYNTMDTKNLNTFIHSLRDAANSLAGKTNPFDRLLMDKLLGRKPIELIRKASQRFAANRIVGSVSAALMQPAAIPSSVLRNGTIKTARGLLMQVGAPLMKNDPLLKSDFLIRRYGKKNLMPGESVMPTKTAKGAKYLSIPFNVIEKNVTKGIWRASFDTAYREGFRGKKLLTVADEIAASVVGGRAIGEKALAFESGLLSLPLQFQLEVNAHAQLWKTRVFDQIFKKPHKAMKAAVETSISLYLFNTFYEALLGRTPLPDPIRAIQDASDAEDWKEAAGRMIGEGLSSVPGGQFVANFFPQELKKKYFGRSEVGIYPGGIPVINAVEGVFYKKENGIYDFVLPYGGGQLKRIIEGVEGINQKGVFNKKGKLKFPVLPSDAVQVVLFGKYSTEEAKEYFDKQRQPLSEKQTLEYFSRTRKGEDPIEAYEAVAANRIRKELDREIVQTVYQKIRSNSTQGFLLIQLWKKQGIIDDKLEKEILTKVWKDARKKIDDNQLYDTAEKLGLFTKEITEESKKEARKITPEEKFKIREGTAAMTGEEVDHLIPVGLGGTKEIPNLRAVKSKINWDALIKDLLKGDFKKIPEDWKKKIRQEGMIPIEAKLVDMFKKGKISQKKAIIAILRAKE